METVRELTKEGFNKAKEVIGELKSSGSDNSTDFLFEERYSRETPLEITIERITLDTRKAIADYLIPKMEPANEFEDYGSIWSWLSMFYLLNNCVDGMKKKPWDYPDEIFFFKNDSSRTYHRRYKHYLWGPWRLRRQHRDSVPFILNNSPFSWSDLEDRTFSKVKIFNSIGVVQLFERLYTRDGKILRNYTKSLGGLRHLIIVLDQLALTYDVYGMQMEQILEILPEEFRIWADKSTVSAD